MQKQPGVLRRAGRLAVMTVLALVALVGVGWLLADQLTPPATGAASHALPVQPAQTHIDRELAPLLAAHPGQTGVLLLADGLDAFAARAIATRQAGRSLDLQYYIWHDDLTGHLLAREIHAAAERGVRVRMLLDDLNAVGLDPQLMALDAHPRIELRLYNPFRNREGPGRILEMITRLVSINHRMHNKAWIADGRLAIVGGRNIGEEYFAADAEVNFRDLDLLLFGPAVSQASGIFDDYWNSAAVVPIAALNRTSPRDLQRMLADVDVEARSAQARPYLERVARSAGVQAYSRKALRPHWSSRIEVVSDPPLKGRGDDSGALVARLADTLGASRREALVVSPYFVPGDAGADLLTGLARDGVVTNSLAANDVPAVHSGYARYRAPLLAQGVRLYELKARALPEGDRGGSSGLFGSSGASLHTKAFVVDGARGFVGSFNLDPRSINLNTEMGVLFDDPAIAADLRDEYLRLASPALSYRVYEDPEGELRWLDGATVPPVVLEKEPDTGAFQRAVVRVLGWLPIESQL